MPRAMDNCLTMACFIVANNVQAEPVFFHGRDEELLIHSTV
jgi:hypothetical protein